jgi:hypothetical protein
LNFEAEGVSVANRVNFQVFTFEQVESWLEDNSGPLDSLGLGTPASADFDVNTGERLWSGRVAPNEVYYVRIFNLSPSPVQFRLTAVGQKTGGIGGFMSVDGASPSETSVIPAAVGVASPAAVKGPGQSSVPPAVAVPLDNASPASTSWLLAAQAIQDSPPQEAAAWLMSAAMLGWLPNGNGAGATQPSAVPVNPRSDLAALPEPEDDGGESEVVVDVVENPLPEAEPDTLKGDSIYPNRAVKLLDSPNTGRLAPKTEHWYTFTPGKVDDKLIENYSLTMFFTPGEPNLARHVTFEMFTGSQYHIWERGTPDDMDHFGAGSWVSRDGDYITGERLWHGTVVDGDKYFVKITNDTNKWVDYHLYPADIINTELGDPSGKKSVPVTANVVASPTGKDIGSPLVAKKGLNAGKLAAGEDIWFSFRTPNVDPDSFEFLPYKMELAHKPGIGAVAHHVNVEIYPFQEQHIWRRGDTDKLTPLGAGSFTEYDEARDSRTWAWDGHLVSNTIYFIRVRNNSPLGIDYDLLVRSK